MTAEFNLPGSSFEEVQRILRGYAHAQSKASNDDISKLTGLHSTVVSRNNKFLVDLGLITSGKAKSATETGKRLARALEHNQAQDTQRYWKEAVQTNEKVSGLVTTVRIKGGMLEKDFSDHVLYVSGQSNTAGNKTGARSVVDMLTSAGLLSEADGRLTVAAPVANDDISVVHSQTSTAPTAQQEGPVLGQPVDVMRQASSQANVDPFAGTGSIQTPQIAINIQLHLPETENIEVYEKLFKALREQLFPQRG